MSDIYTRDMAYYSRDKVTQAVRKHSTIKTKNHLYTVIAIIEKAIHIVDTTKVVLPEKRQQLVETYTKRIIDILPDLVRSVDIKQRYQPNNLIKEQCLNQVERFTRMVRVDILTNDFLNYSDKLTNILHNVLLIVTQTTEVIKFVGNDRYWQSVISMICDLIEILDSEYDDSIKESSVIYDTIFKSLLHLRNSEVPILTSEWDSILLTQEE